MCGIVGYTGHNIASEIIIDSLKKLEYRGYDSAGLTLHGKKLVTTKKEGPIVNLEEVLKKSNATMGIGHTRWATLAYLQMLMHILIWMNLRKSR